MTAALLRISQKPSSGALCRFSAEELAGTRRVAVTGFAKHLIFYQARLPGSAERTANFARGPRRSRSGKPVFLSPRRAQREGGASATWRPIPSGGLNNTVIPALRIKRTSIKGTNRCRVLNARQRTTVLVVDGSILSCGLFRFLFPDWAVRNTLVRSVGSACGGVSAAELASTGGAAGWLRAISKFTP